MAQASIELLPEGASKVWSRPETMTDATHHLCPGCGEPIAVRLIGEVLQELGVRERTILVNGIGCYGALGKLMNVDRVKALHGRAPSVATGIKRMLPDRVVYTVQGDGDMVSEGLQEVLHAAARREKITAILLNNTVFGETGGHMTSTTPLGQKTKSTLEGRQAETHGDPIKLAELVAQMPGAVYVARGAVHSPSAIGRTKRMIRKAFEAQLRGEGFSLVEILTMCPSGWFLEPWEGPQFLQNNLLPSFPMGELRSG
jgi:2-oxoglutarate ferredoxin oxidoreductase subunit beta